MKKNLLNAVCMILILVFSAVASAVQCMAGDTSVSSEIKLVETDNGFVKKMNGLVPGNDLAVEIVMNLKTENVQFSVIDTNTKVSIAHSSGGFNSRGEAMLSYQRLILGCRK